MQAIDEFKDDDIDGGLPHHSGPTVCIDFAVHYVVRACWPHKLNINAAAVSTCTLPIRCHAGCCSLHKPRTGGLTGSKNALKTCHARRASTCLGADQGLALQAGFGDSLKLVGSLPETGEWDVAAAPAMSWCACAARDAACSRSCRRTTVQHTCRSPGAVLKAMVIRSAVSMNVRTLAAAAAEPLGPFLQIMALAVMQTNAAL